MKKLLLTASGIFLAASLYIGINSYKNINSVSDLLLANVEALADDESAGPCTQGCKQIGWGWDQILKCSCDYTFWFSTCDSWGCVQ